MSQRAAVLKSQIAPGANVKNFQVVGNGAVFAMDVPPLNTLGAANREAIAAAVDAAASNDAIKFLVITGKGKAFCAGADITEFGALAGAKGAQTFDEGKMLPAILNKIERLKKPVIAAINGIALGGGCELALACHYRVAAKSAAFGLPEIKLGLIPGAGGTQRLPRLVGIQNAIQMCCTGNNVKSAVALKWGLVDKVADGDVIADALAFGEAHVAAKKPIRRLSQDTSKLGNFVSNAFVFNAARKKISGSIPKGMISPLGALDAVQAASKGNFEAGLKAERDIFLKLAQSPQAKAMQHFFFAERLAMKIPGLPRTEARQIRSVGVIGGGTMGGGIAMNFLNRGIPVVIIESADDRKQFAIDTIAKNYKISVSRGRLTEELFNKRMSLLRVVVNDYSALQDVDYVIEAVFESMKLKKEIFAKLDKVCKSTCVLASNTSTLSIDEIASATTRPQKVIGAHFFSPANVMKLLEFVRGKATDAETINTSMAVGKLINKAPVLCGNCFGFISNRMMMRGGFQTHCMLEEGCVPIEVDVVVKDFGFPMGPFAMSDLAGIDVSWRIRGETPAAFIPKRDCGQIMEQLVKANRFGQKTQKGWYIYDKADTRKPIPDPEVDKIILSVSKQKNIKRRNISKQEILERYLYAMINEAAYILLEGFAIRPSDIDIVFIYGFGFPPYKGGPMHYADFVGLPKVVEAIKKYNTALGSDTFPPPCPLLVDLASQGKTFGSLNK